MPGRRQIVAGLLATAGMLVARQAAAASLEFQPVVTEASSGAFTSTLDVINRGGGEAALQMRAFTWTQAAGAADTLTETSAIILSPPMFTLPDGEQQTVRLVMRTQAAPIEQAFRILIDEIPRAEAGQVRMTLRISLPVFVAGGSGGAELQWHAAPASGGVLVSVRNIGTRRSRIANLSLAGADHAAVAGRLLDQNPYVLAGGERRWLVPLRLRAGEQVQIKADHENGPIAVPLAIGA